MAFLVMELELWSSVVDLGVAVVDLEVVVAFEQDRDSGHHHMTVHGEERAEEEGPDGQTFDLGKTRLWLILTSTTTTTKILLTNVI